MRRRLSLMSASVAALSVLSAGSAAAQTWLGTASSDWTNGANWSGGTPPVAGSVIISNLAGPEPILGVNGPAAGTTGNFTIGSAGTNSLTIENGSTLTSSGNTINIGTNASGTATVTVTGAGSQWNTLGLTVANNGVGILNIDNGASVAAGVLRVGPTVGRGTVNINDGTLVTGGLSVGTTSAANFDNAILRATATAPAWINSRGTLNIAAGGLTIDTAGFTVGANATSVFSGVGGLTKIDAGTLSLAAANTYTGQTVIQAGTLALTGAGSVAASSRVVANGTFDVSASTAPTIKSLAGTGGVTLGANNLTITNANDQFAGHIAGTGGLVLTGGTLGLTGTNSYTGATNVNGGALRVDGSIASSSLTTVKSGATLTGTGTVGDTQVDTGATFAPGNGTLGGSPSALPTPGSSMTVAGNLAFQSGALYFVSVNLSTASFANVTGTASLAGTVQAYVNGATSNKPLDILHSAGLNGTTFSGLTLINSNYRASLSYTATDVYLTLIGDIGGGPSGTIPPPCSGTFSQNQCNVAVSLNNFFNNGGTLSSSFANVFGLTGSQLGSALYHLDGEDATGAERAAFQLTNQFLSLMLDPFVYGRSGGFGGGGGGGAVGFAPEQQDNLPPDVALAYASILNKAPALPSFDPRWTAWGAAFGGSSNTRGDQTNTGSSNVTANTYGFAAGMDYHVTPTTLFGFALAGGGTNWGLANALGTGRSDALQAGVYGISWFGPAYVAGALSFSNHWFTTSRSALGDQMNASFDGQSYGARLESGYRYAVLPILGVTPYGAVQFQDFHTPAYSESDATAGGFALSYPSLNATDVRTEVGSRLDAPTLFYGMPLVLRGRLAWAHDFVSNPVLNPAFQSLPGASFTVYGAQIPHDSALTSAGAELFLTPRWTLLAKFDGEFATGSQTYAGSGTLRYTW
jgi:T5SS/PEP-CTERM-associated repeat protein/autotransporter-associated beta strand protein